MRRPLISCIIPTYNGARYLEDALNSIRAQTYRSVEIIVVDDGSTDDTVAVVGRFDGPVRYIWQPNAGSAAARNHGIQTAQGEFVAFLDADDIWHETKLERQMVRFEKRPELAACVTHVQNFWTPELREEAARFREHRLARPVPGYVTQTLLARRLLFDTAGMFNAELKHGDNTDWFLRVAEQGAVIELLPDVLVYRRLHRTNQSRLGAMASRNEYLHIIKARLDRRRDRSAAVKQKRQQ